MPAIWPESLIPTALSELPRSTIVFPFHKNESEDPALVCAEQIWATHGLGWL